MLKLVVLLAFVAICVADEVKIEEDEGVLVLTTENFDQAIKDNKFILVEFYAPWCGHCKNLAPEYAQAAQALAEDNAEVKLAKVDATEQSALGTKFGVKGYPTLKFFIDGEPSEYGGGRTKDTIITWLKKKTGPPATSLQTMEDVEKLTKKEVAIVGFFKDQESEEATNFLKVAQQNDDFQFGITSDESVFKKYEVEGNTVVLFKQFDEKRADLKEDLSVEAIKTFVREKSVALLTVFNQVVAQKLFADKDTPFFFLIMSRTADNYEKVAESVSKLAEDNRGKFKAVVLDTDDSGVKRVVDYLGVQEAEYPSYRFLNLGKSLKYKPEDADLEKIGDFVKEFVAGVLKPFLKSQDVPEDWNAQPVKVLTGKNFKEVAFDEDKHVFVEFYAPWCGHCKKLTPIWDELATKFADNEDVVIAKMDSTENEVEEVQIQGFPTLKFFPKGSSKIEDYKGGRELNDLVEFLSKHSPLVEKAEEKAEEKEEEAKEEQKEEKKEDKKDDKKKDEL